MKPLARYPTRIKGMSERLIVNARDIYRIANPLRRKILLSVILLRSHAARIALAPKDSP
jgi:hypothetical protein